MKEKTFYFRHSRNEMIKWKQVAAYNGNVSLSVLVRELLDVEYEKMRDDLNLDKLSEKDLDIVQKCVEAFKQ